MTELTKDQKIAKIYEVIADKTLSFWCAVRYDTYGREIVAHICFHDYEMTDSKSLLREYDCGEAGSLTVLNRRTTNDDQVVPLSAYEEYKKIRKYTRPITDIVGHPVMLWDVLAWIESKLEDNYFWNFYIEDLIMDICNKRKHKRKPIDDQDEDCVSFVYSLIKDQWQN